MEIRPIGTIDRPDQTPKNEGAHVTMGALFTIRIVLPQRNRYAARLRRMIWIPTISPTTSATAPGEWTYYFVTETLLSKVIFTFLSSFFR